MIKIDYYPAVAKILFSSADKIFCSFCLKELVFDENSILGRCECKFFFKVSIGLSDRAIYYIGYKVFQGNLEYRIHYNFYNENAWIQKWHNNSLIKEISFNISGVDYLIKDIESIENYFLFS